MKLTTMDIPAMPARVKALPLDPMRGLPLPWFVYRPKDWKEGDAVDFRVADADKRMDAYARGLCWVCGQSRGPARDRGTAVFGPMCLCTRTTAEPLMHRDCAMWSARAGCPFLTRPQMRRSPRAFDEEHANAKVAGVAIERNPGVVCVASILGNFKAFSDGKGNILFRLPISFESLEFYTSGRRATFDEVMTSIETGLPILREASKNDGIAGVEFAEKEIARAIRQVRSHFANGGAT